MGKKQMVYQSMSDWILTYRKLSKNQGEWRIRVEF